MIGSRCGSSRRTEANAGARSPSCPRARTRSRTGCATTASRRGDRMIVMLGNQVELWETDAGGDEARRRGHPGHPAARARRPRRPRRARRRPPRRRERARRREVRRRGRRLHADRDRRTDRRVAALRRRRPSGDRLHARRPDRGLGPAAAVLHLRNDGQAQAGRAQSRLLSRRASLDHVLGRDPARRHPPQRLFPGLGQARVEQRVRAVARRGDGDGLQLHPLRRARRCSTRSSAAA